MDSSCNRVLMQVGARRERTRCECDRACADASVCAVPRAGAGGTAYQVRHGVREISIMSNAHVVTRRCQRWRRMRAATAL
jgi:hypothetical protein